MDDPYRLAPLPRLLFGLLFVAAGALPMLAAIDFGPLKSADINGPAWLGLVSGGAFVLVGLMILFGPFPDVVNGLLAAVLTACLATAGNWIAFGAGERFCAGSLSIPQLWGEGDMSGLACRIPFGIGAVICNALVCYIVAVTLQKAAGGKPRLARVVKAAEWLVLVSLLPILLPLLVWALGSAAVGALKERWRTGQWPRNEEFIARQKRRLAERRKTKKS